MAQGQVKVVWRQFAFLGEESVQAAAASDCAAEQDMFWQYHHRLYEVQAGRNSGVFSADNLKRYGGEVGLEPTAFESCIDSGRHVANIQTETERGRQRGIQRTPTLMINGVRKLEGVPTINDLQQAIRQVATSLTPAPR